MLERQVGGLFWKEGRTKSRAYVASRSIEMGIGPQVGYPRWRRSWEASGEPRAKKESSYQDGLMRPNRMPEGNNKLLIRPSAFGSRNR